MLSQSKTIQVKGLAKRQVARVAARAGRLGMTPGRYVRHLVEQDLAISDRAKNTTLAQMMGAGSPVDEQEVDRRVEAAKSRHHRRAGHKE